MGVQGQERVGIGSSCEHCGSKMVTTGRERTKEASAFGGHTHRILEREYVCQGHGCARTVWVEEGAA